MNGYCKVCKNEKVEKDEPCALCDKHVVNGWLAEAYRRWVKVAEDNRVCCRGLSYPFGRGTDSSSREQGHLYFHGKYWEASFNSPLGLLSSTPGTHVEYGVSFHHDHARTYYLRDFDHTADSEEYGEKIPYLAPDFWETLENQLERAATEAWRSGLLTCDECGYHYFTECPHDDEEVDDAG